MTKTLTETEALELVKQGEFTTQMTLVVNNKRTPFTPTVHAGPRPFYDKEPGGFWTKDDLRDLILTGAILELETPSPFDDEAFEGWEHVPGRGYPCKKIGDFEMDAYGGIEVFENDLVNVPIDRIPEAARLINALLALGDGK